MAKAPCGGSISMGLRIKAVHWPLKPREMERYHQPQPWGLTFFGPGISRIHRGATGSRGKLKPFMLWVRIPPMEPPQVVQSAEAADLKSAKYGFESLLGDQSWRGRTAMHRPRKSEDEVSESSASSRNIFANGEKLDIHTLIGEGAGGESPVVRWLHPAWQTNMSGRTWFESRLGRILKYGNVPGRLLGRISLKCLHRLTD